MFLYREQEVSLCLYLRIIVPSTLQRSTQTTTTEPYSPLNYPDCIKATLSWLEVPLWYMLRWPFPRHTGWLYSCGTAVLASIALLPNYSYCHGTYRLTWKKGGLALARKKHGTRWHTAAAEELLLSFSNLNELFWGSGLFQYLTANQFIYL